MNLHKNLILILRSKTPDRMLKLVQFGIDYGKILYSFKT